jgi:hypothetical protein
LNVRKLRLGEKQRLPHDALAVWKSRTQRFLLRHEHLRAQEAKRAGKDRQGDQKKREWI